MTQTEKVTEEEEDGGGIYKERGETSEEKLATDQREALKGEWRPRRESHSRKSKGSSGSNTFRIRTENSTEEVDGGELKGREEEEIER